MTRSREQREASNAALHLRAAAALLLVLGGTARCSPSRAADPSTGGTLRVGIGGAPSQNPQSGVRAFISNISVEGLLRVDREGRARPLLAESWERSLDGLLVTIHLRRNVTFTDGSPVEASTVAEVLKLQLPTWMGSPFEDVESITAASPSTIEIRLRRPSQFLTESLDVPIVKGQKPVIGTAPFVVGPKKPEAGSSTELVAYSQYYLGKPVVEHIVVNEYPNVRAAWADLLRDRLDMVYEVGPDALDSLRGANNVSVFNFDRPYQYAVILNTESPALKSREVRRALNQAIDRVGLVRDVLGSQGTPSSGPVSPHHWAFHETGATFSYAPDIAAKAIAASQPSRKGRLTLHCLVYPGPPYERLVLMLKQQLADVGVDLVAEELPADQIMARLPKRDFEAVLSDIVSGWSLFRPSRWSHSKGTLSNGYSNPKVDAALDQVRHAVNDDDYRDGVAAFQAAIADDPPSIFLAWSGRSRAVTRRFSVPQPEPGRDVLQTLRSWHPVDTQASRN